jgi:hypothetical protein
MFTKTVSRALSTLLVLSAVIRSHFGKAARDNFRRLLGQMKFGTTMFACSC